ncbi:MAG: hypothetical protein U0L71_05950 [Eggerthellaceae bacterium]|nr:hypothetical protein [Eggerthellaceae bacterium]
MESFFGDSKTVECIKVGLSLNSIKEILESCARNYINAKIHVSEDAKDGTASIVVDSPFTPKLLDDYLVEKIVRATPLYAETVMKCVLTDREIAERGGLGLSGGGMVYIPEYTDSYTVIEFDLDCLDRKPSFFGGERAIGFQTLKLCAAAAGFELEYEPEPGMTLRDALNAIKEATDSWEKVKRAEWEHRAELRMQAARKKEQEEKEKRRKLIKEAKTIVIKGVEQGKYESCNEAIADLDIESSIVGAAWRGTKKERAEAYWNSHPERRLQIEASLSQAKSDLSVSRHCESDLRKELESLTGWFKGKKRREIVAKIEAEAAKQEQLQKKVDKLSSQFESMPE